MGWEIYFIGVLFSAGYTSNSFETWDEVKNAWTWIAFIIFSALSWVWLAIAFSYWISENRKRYGK